MTEERIEELRELVWSQLQEFVDDEFFTYGWWDGLVEDGELTHEEFRKLKDLFTVEVSVEKYEPMP